MSEDSKYDNMSEEECLSLAKLSEQAERFEDMAAVRESSVACC